MYCSTPASPTGPSSPRSPDEPAQIRSAILVHGFRSCGHTSLSVLGDESLVWQNDAGIVPGGWATVYLRQPKRKQRRQGRALP